MDVLTGKFQMRANGKAVAMQETEGFVKVVADRETRRIIGATIIGAGATELLSLATNLVTCGITIDEAAKVIYAHPTLSEAVSEAILDLAGE
jgi:dihydrolipoamide dehydrogenase